jgi:hypothetical protein
MAARIMLKRRGVGSVLHLLDFSVEAMTATRRPTRSSINPGSLALSLHAQRN